MFSCVAPCVRVVGCGGGQSGGSARCMKAHLPQSASQQLKAPSCSCLAHGCQLPGCIPSCMAGVLGTHQHGGKPQTVLQVCPFPMGGQGEAPAGRPLVCGTCCPTSPCCTQLRVHPQRWGLRCEPSFTIGQDDCTVCPALWACQKCKGFNRRRYRC